MLDSRHYALVKTKENSTTQRVNPNVNHELYNNVLTFIHQL